MEAKILVILRSCNELANIFLSAPLIMVQIITPPLWIKNKRSLDMSVVQNFSSIMSWWVLLALVAQPLG